MEKLELKHLAPYLPYELKMYYEFLHNNKPRQWTLRCGTITEALINQNKPILRPLYDLLKNEKFLLFCKEQITGANIKIIYDYFNDTIVVGVLGGENVMIALCNEIAAECPYLFYEWLVGNHYDIFGLIEKGLAIDINTL